MKLDEYVTGKRDPNTGAVNKSTFCYRLENVMDKLSKFGVRSALAFGVYYSKETQEYKYKGDFSSAEVIFDKIKTELKSLIEAGELFSYRPQSGQSVSYTRETSHYSEEFAIEDSFTILS